MYTDPVMQFPYICFFFHSIKTTYFNICYVYEVQWYLSIKGSAFLTIYSTSIIRPSRMTRMIGCKADRTCTYTSLMGRQCTDFGAIMEVYITDHVIHLHDASLIPSCWAVVCSRCRCLSHPTCMPF